MHNVLLVDDEPYFRDALNNLVNWQEHGFQVIGEVYDGLEAVEAMKQHSVDIVLTDIKMPKMNGLDLISHIIRNYPGISIIVLSAYDEFHLVSEAFKRGAEDYILKWEMTGEHVIQTAMNVLKKKQDTASRFRIVQPETVREDKKAAVKETITNKAKNYIREHFQDNISLSEVADAIGISPGYLSRIFYKETGYNFSMYLTNVRMEAAVEYLRNSGLKIYQIAEKVGYVSAEHFSRAFKKAMGKSPRDYHN